MPPSVVVCVIEPVVPADPAALASVGGMLVNDLNMMARTGGRERTEAEFTGVLAGAGLRLDEVVPPDGPDNYSVLRAGSR